MLKHGSQYHAGTVSVTGKSIIFTSQIISLANAGDATLELKLSLFQCQPDARDTTLV